MANANAIVDKMAQVGLRHGEKAGVAIAMTVFLVCVAAAIQEKGIETTPDQIKKVAEQAQQNLNRKEERDAIIKRLEETDKIEPTDFAARVEKQVQVKLVADQYRPARTWVTPEPGAGLIRDTPELIAPSELYAFPGRGGLLVFALDDEGNKIPYKEGEEKEAPHQKYGKVRKKGSGMGGSGMMGGMMGQPKKKKRKSKEEIAREAKAEQERLARNLSKSLAGAVPEADTSEDEKKKKEEEEDGGPYKEVTQGYRWVVITGILDHGQLLENYRKALKNPSVAHPQYLRLDLQRRTQQPDGSWSDWADVDIEKNYSVLDNITDEEEELVEENKLPDNLVDHLPFLTAGLYSGVHVARLVPKEKRQLPEDNQNAMGMGMGGPGGMAMGSGNMAAMMQANQQNMQGMMQGGKGRMWMMGMMQGSGSAGMGMPMGETETVGNYWKSEEKQVMIRALDYTVQPDETYRYRVRIVVANPNYNRDDVGPGVNRKDTKLFGPWSKETDVVTMPPDVQPYAVRALPFNVKTGPRVLFQVVRFNPGDGWTVPARFDAGLGEVIGEIDRESVPKSDGSGTKTEQIDFNSHQIVLDIGGGGFQNLPNGMLGPKIERPALAALLRHDGAMIVHSEADDLANPFRKDIESNYTHELHESDSKKKREHSQGGGYGSMMGSMMQMMGGSRGAR